MDSESRPCRTHRWRRPGGPCSECKGGGHPLVSCGDREQKSLSGVFVSKTGVRRLVSEAAFMTDWLDSYSPNPYHSLVRQALGEAPPTSPAASVTLPLALPTDGVLASCHSDHRLNVAPSHVGLFV